MSLRTVITAKRGGEGEEEENSNEEEKEENVIYAVDCIVTDCHGLVEVTQVSEVQRATETFKWFFHLSRCHI